MKTITKDGKPTKIYKVWDNMKSRCLNPNHPDYVHYGGRGIKISEDWMDFHNFATDMLPSYQKGLSLDRIDNNGGYSKENCRWATSAEQQRNRRKNRMITINGKTKCVADWADEYNIKLDTALQRMYKGWDEVEALTSPLLRKHKNKDKNKLKRLKN